jgi:hypothetical protein
MVCYAGQPAKARILADMQDRLLAEVLPVRVELLNHFG